MRALGCFVNVEPLFILKSALYMLCSGSAYDMLIENPDISIAILTQILYLFTIATFVGLMLRYGPFSSV